MKKLLIALAFAFPALVLAQALPAPPVHVPTPNYNTYTYSGGTVTAANASSVAFPPAANGSIYTEASYRQPLGSGASADIKIRAKPAPADIGRAIGRFLGRASGALVVGAAAYQLCNELGYECNTMLDGALGITKNVSGCTAYHSGFPQASRVSGPSCAGLALQSVQKLVDAGVMGPGNLNLLNCNSAPIPYCELQGDTPFRFTVDAPQTVPKTIQDLENDIASKSGWPSNSALPKVLQDAVKAGEPLPVPAPYEITGPASVPLPPVTITRPDGSTINDSPSKEIAYGPNTVSVTDKSVKTETNPQGVTTPISTSTSAQPLPQPAPQPAPTPDPPKDPCGLPDTPACIVDGSGAPTAEELPDDAAKKALNPVEDFLKNPFSLVPQLPTINWAFALPTACGNIPTPAFAPYLTGVDVCQFQPMFHELMSMVWMLGGLFGAISLFMRSSLAD